MALQDTLDTIMALGHTIIALAAPITTQLNAAAWKNHLDLVSSDVEQHDAIVIVPFDDIDAASVFAAYAETKSSYRFIAACYHGTTQLPELSGSIAAALASGSDVAVPFDDIALPGLSPVDSTNTLSKTRIEAALRAGVAVVATGEDGLPKIVRLITTYQQKPDGESDDLMLDANAPLILAYTRTVVRQTVKAQPRKKNTVAARKNLRTQILVKLKQLDAAEILQNVDARAAELTVTLNSTDATRADVSIPADMVRGMHIVAATLNVY
jgi:phage tail sheath gpL-like